jgi:predicted ArsR family transcriptional regulator
MQATREAILRHLQREGRATVKELGEVLGLTSTGIRQHLTVLERDGLVESHEERGKVGRPALVYRLTDRADSVFPKNYDVLANLLLEEVLAMNGQQQLQALLRRVSTRMVERHTQRLEGKDMEGRVAETVQILQDQGCVADWERQGDEFYIRECTCPYPKVAREHSAVCALEVDFVRQLTGGDARLVSSLLRGDKACTYRIRPAASPAAGKPGEG